LAGAYFPPPAPELCPSIARIRYFCQEVFYEDETEGRKQKPGVRRQENRKEIVKRQYEKIRNGGKYYIHWPKGHLRPHLPLSRQQERDYMRYSSHKGFLLKKAYV